MLSSLKTVGWPLLLSLLSVAFFGDKSKTGGAFALPSVGEKVCFDSIRLRGKTYDGQRYLFVCSRGPRRKRARSAKRGFAGVLRGASAND